MPLCTVTEGRHSKQAVTTFVKPIKLGKSLLQARRGVSKGGADGARPLGGQSNGEWEG